MERLLKRSALVVAAAMVAFAAPVGAAESPGPDDIARLAVPMPRHPLADESVYFLMIDRYANGDFGNDRGDDRTASGFDPKNPAYYHGGDLVGLTQNLERIRRLGFTALWITPPFLNNTVQGNSAAYHGYWINDFTRIDPHFGTTEEFATFVARAHELGLKVYLDIVMNHTGDVIRYRDGYNFSPTATKQPYVPADLANAKAPAFLNDLANYHNQGNIDNWNDADQSRNGDFYGLDDIKTEQPAVVDGFASVYADWVKRYGIDGFRIDTAKHVDANFFSRWIPAFMSRAGVTAQNFAMFGEVYDAQVRTLAGYIRSQQLPSVLDFALQPAVAGFAAGDQDASRLFGVVTLDDLYNVGATADGFVANAYSLPVFGGNHDMGRTALMLMNEGAARSERQFLPRVKLAHSTLFLLRGAPVTYYGDEVGMIGYGGDQSARQSMFPTKVVEWQEQDRVGSPAIGTRSSLTATTERHPLAVHLRQLNELRSRYVALRSGALLPRLTKGSVAAWSRIDATERREFVVLQNNAAKPVTVTLTTSSPKDSFRGVFGSRQRLVTDARGRLRVTVPALSTVVLRAERQLPAAPVATPMDVVMTKVDGTVPALRAVPRTPLNDPSSVTFAVQRCSDCGWQTLMTDDAAPFVMVFPEQLPVGARITAITRTSSGAVAVGGTHTFAGTP